MTRKNILVDAGVIVAALQSNDQWHVSSAELFLELPKPFLTCEAVITEACFLLNKQLSGAAQVFKLIETATISIDFSLAKERQNVNALMEKYSDVPMSLAHACLVRMSEIFDAAIFTFDADFRIYRRNRNSIIPLIGIDG